MHAEATELGRLAAALLRAWSGSRPRASGSLLATFRSSAYLTDGEDRLLWLGRDPSVLPARGVIVDLDFARLPQAGRCRWDFSEGTLRIGTAAVVTIHAARHEPPAASIAGKACPTWPARVRDLIAALRATHDLTSASVGLLGEPLAPLLAPLQPSLSELEGALVSDAAAADVSAAAVSLLGAGFGLTPSGDDFLGGLLGTLSHASRQPPALAEVTAALVSAAPDRTTAISATLLRDLLAGAAPRHLGRFWAQLFSASADPQSLHAAADGLLGHGATSGWDFLAGVAAAGRIFAARTSSTSSTASTASAAKG